jgi:hypothetical protein
MKKKKRRKNRERRVMREKMERTANEYNCAPRTAPDLSAVMWLIFFREAQM